jgi:transcriptional regulator with XRE-family HTH domain
MGLGARIRIAREQKGWWQAQLAEALGVEPPTVSRWENEVNAPSPEHLLKIASLTGKTIEWLRGAEAAPRSQEADIEKRLAMLEQLAYPSVSDELRTLRAETAKLRDPEIQRLIRAWEQAPSARNKAVFLYFLTGDDADLLAAGQTFRVYARKMFQVLGLSKTKVSS